MECGINLVTKHKDSDLVAMHQEARKRAATLAGVDLCGMGGRSLHLKRVECTQKRDRVCRGGQCLLLVPHQTLHEYAAMPPPCTLGAGLSAVSSKCTGGAVTWGPCIRLPSHPTTGVHVKGISKAIWT